MKAIILCAGYGTRLGSLTKEVPKPMLIINGKPLLEYTVRYLVKNGFTDIGINLHFKPESIKEYFKDGNSYGASITYTYEESLLGTAGAVVQFEDWIGQDNFLVIYGDLLIDQDLSILVNRHKNKDAFATLLLHERKESNSIVALGKNNRIEAFLERPSDEERKKYFSNIYNANSLVNSGVQFLSNDALHYIKENNCFDLPKDVYVKTFRSKNLYGEILSGLRVAIDSIDRYHLANTAVKGYEYNIENIRYE